ncbi:hypothetical protein GCM10022381_03560 [Leifsonia kafniensis]|uniref:Cardiolipin synthase N-terminal domain-containing protein n=1 Tax=Leifsonia kafniensis TaxID=475957 RepID=A0ABP7K463_9MICO
MNTKLKSEEKLKKALGKKSKQMKQLAKRKTNHMAKQPDKRTIIPTLIVHVIVMTLTWRDISSRTDAEVRGNKAVWRVASALNTIGSVAYWVFGRKPRT